MTNKELQAEVRRLKYALEKIYAHALGAHTARLAEGKLEQCRQIAEKALLE